MGGSEPQSESVSYCCVMLCSVTLCCVVLCSVALCCVVLCRVVCSKHLLYKYLYNTMGGVVAVPLSVSMSLHVTSYLDSKL